MRDEERADRVEVSLNIHLQADGKNIKRIQDDFKCMLNKVHSCEDDIDVVQQGQKDQETLNHAIVERMQEIEAKMRGQGEKIVRLEEEIAVLRSRKACTCGGEREEVTVVPSSGNQEELSELEYTSDEESGSDGSYHLPTVAQEEPLLVFGSPLSQSLPVEVQETCGHPVTTLIEIEDNVKMPVVPRENESPIPVQVERPPRYDVGSQCASCSRPLAHFKSSTRCTNHHAKQLGFCPYPPVETFHGLDLSYPSVREFCARLLARGGGTDQGSSGHVGGSVGSSEDPGAVADKGHSLGSLTFSTTSTCYLPCSPNCGGNCLGGDADLHGL